MIVRPVTPNDEAQMLGLFSRCSNTCYCRFLHFHGDKNEWLLQASEAGAGNRQAYVEALRADSDETRGVVAEDQGRIVAFMKLAPRGVSQKAYEQRYYRSLPCLTAEAPPGTFLLGCVLIDPLRRREGLTDDLVRGALELARQLGATRVDAFPRVPKEPVSDDELWTLPVGPLKRAGFEEVGGEHPYPVLRKEFNE